MALNSGWDARVSGPGFRNVDAGNVMRFPEFHGDTAQALAQRGVVGVASDTLSLDRGGSTTFDFHKAWLGSGHWGIEAIAGLNNLPPTGATLIAGAPKFAGG